MNLPKKFGQLVVSDLHLNHPKLNTKEMVDSLIHTITQNHVKDFTRYLIIPGDVFDRPTQTDTQAGKEITRFISFTLEFSVLHGLILYVLKGTGSHDGDQSDHFVSMNDGRINKAELKYVDKIDIWTDKYGLRWLGVPDESTPSAAQTQAEIESLMKKMGVTQVDMGLTHGLYNTHNLNGIIDHHAHDTEFYCKIVKYLILNGHIHHPSRHYKLLTIGSHDRVRHGEEEAKGGWTITVDLTAEEVSATFFENKRAAKFVTYTITSEDIKRAYREVDKYLISNSLMRGGFLRLAYLDTININDLVRLLQDKYSPEIEFTTPKKISTADKAEDELNSRVIEFSKISTTPITKSTVNELLMDKLERMGVEDKNTVLEAFKSL